MWLDWRSGTKRRRNKNFPAAIIIDAGYVAECAAICAASGCAVSVSA